MLDVVATRNCTACDKSWRLWDLNWSFNERDAMGFPRPLIDSLLPILILIGTCSPISAGRLDLGLYSGDEFLERRNNNIPPARKDMWLPGDSTKLRGESVGMQTFSHAGNAVLGAIGLAQSLKGWGHDSDARISAVGFGLVTAIQAWGFWRLWNEDNGKPGLLPRQKGSLYVPDASKTYGPDWNVRYVGSLITHAEDRLQITGQDGAYSIDLGTSSLWLFHDTFYGTRAEDGSAEVKGAVDNTAGWTPDRDASDGILGMRHFRDLRGKPNCILSHAASEDLLKIKLWPGHGIKIGSRIYLFYSLVEVLGTGSWDFRHAGQGLAIGAEPLEPFTRLTHDQLYEFWSREQPRFGIAVLGDKDGWIYVYGREEKQPHGLKLARVRAEHIEDPKDYEYFSQERKYFWSHDLSQATPLFQDAPPEASVSLNSYLGKYLMIYSRLLEKDVAARTADHPWGPWSRPQSIHRCVLSKTDAYCYAAKEHPEYVQQRGRITYFTVVDSGRALGGIPELFKLTFSPDAAAKF